MSEFVLSFRVIVNGNFMDAALPVAEKRNILNEKLNEFENHIIDEFDMLMGDRIGEVLNGFETEFRFIHVLDVADARESFITTTKVLIDMSTEDIITPEVEDQVREILRGNLDGLADNLQYHHLFDGEDAPGVNAGEGDEVFTGLGVITTAYGAQNGGRRRGAKKTRKASKKRRVSHKRRASHKRRSATRKNKRRASHKRRVSHKRRA
jgi:hypothetical protein